MKAILIIVWATTQYGWGEPIGIVTAYPTMKACEDYVDQRAKQKLPGAIKLYGRKCHPYPLDAIR